MRISALVLAAATMLAAGMNSAEARPNDGSMWSALGEGSVTATVAQPKSKARSARYTRTSASGVGGRPRKWCGWWMRTQKGGGPEYNLAWNWRKYGSPSGPQIGAVVVWPHHVGMITGRTADGRWIVKSGNDSGRVRERARSVAGAIFRI